MSRSSAGDLGQRTTHAVAWNLVNIVASRASSFVVFSVLSRILDKSAFGSVALTLSLLALLEIVTSQSVGDFIVKCEDLDNEYLDSTFWVNIGLGVLLGGAFMFASVPLAAHYKDPDLIPIGRALAVTLVTHALSVIPSALLARELRFRELTTRNLWATLLGGASGIVAALGGLGAMSLVVQILVSETAAVVLLWRMVGWRPGIAISAAKLKVALGFGLPMLGASLLYFIARRADVLIIGDALGIVALGTYVLGQRITQIVGQILHKSNDAVFFSAFVSMPVIEREQTLLRGVRLAAAICFPIYAGIALVATPLIGAIFGSKWAAAAPVLVILSISQMYFVPSTFNAIAIKAMGRTRLLFRVHLVLTGVFVISLYLLAPYGLAATAAATLIAYSIAYPYECWIAIQITGVRGRAYLRALAAPIAATSVMAIAVESVRIALARVPLGHRPIFDLGLSTMIGVVVYALVLRILAQDAASFIAAKLHLIARRMRRITQEAQP